MWTLWILSAWGWETDPLTRRDQAPADALAAVDAQMNKVLDEAAGIANGRLKCKASLARSQKVLAQTVHELLGGSVLLTERGLVRGQGYDTWAAWMERAEHIERITLIPKETIYGELGALESVILSMGGTCSMYTVDGHYVGSDKFDHFLAEGYEYYERSKGGRRPDKGLAFGVRSELHVFGLDTSLTFSFGDLAANYDGYTFFAGLLVEGSVMQLDEEGCITREGDFTWARYVDWRWDEATNPSVYRPWVEEAVQERLEARRDHYCAIYEDLGGAEYDALLAAKLQTPTPWAQGEDVPERTDPFRLGELCAED